MTLPNLSPFLHVLKPLIDRPTQGAASRRLTPQEAQLLVRLIDVLQRNFGYNLESPSQRGLRDFQRIPIETLRKSPEEQQVLKPQEPLRPVREQRAPIEQEAMGRPSEPSSARQSSLPPPSSAAVSFPRESAEEGLPEPSSSLSPGNGAEVLPELLESTVVRLPEDLADRPVGDLKDHPSTGVVRNNPSFKLTQPPSSSALPSKGESLLSRQATVRIPGNFSLPSEKAVYVEKGTSSSLPHPGFTQGQIHTLVQFAQLTMRFLEIRGEGLSYSEAKSLSENFIHLHQTISMLNSQNNPLTSMQNEMLRSMEKQLARFEKQLLQELAKTQPEMQKTSGTQLAEIKILQGEMTELKATIGALLKEGASVLVKENALIAESKGSSTPTSESSKAATTGVKDLPLVNAKPNEIAIKETSRPAELAPQIKPEADKAALILNQSQATKTSAELSEMLKMGLNRAAALPNQIVTVRSAAEISAIKEHLSTKLVRFPLALSVSFPLTPQGPNSATQAKSSRRPQEQEEENAEGEEGDGGGDQQQAMIYIPDGVCLMEEETVQLEAFLMAATAVTNAQFADWLNKKHKRKELNISARGLISDHRGTALCRTIEGASTSQIEVSVSKGELRFKAASGMDNHPVVHVSWQGAEAFCRDNGVRLPTEAEWERAAGMDKEKPGELPRKFRFGCAQDEIDLSYANYREEFQPAKENLTKAVGFYNGATVYTKQRKSIATQQACSPFGCYDMSGNVREWVQGEGGVSKSSHKITKGGSYNSPPAELEVSAKTILSDDTMDPFTGFRVAVSL